MGPGRAVVKTGLSLFAVAPEPFVGGAYTDPSGLRRFFRAQADFDNAFDEQGSTVNG